MERKIGTIFKSGAWYQVVLAPKEGYRCEGCNIGYRVGSILISTTKEGGTCFGKERTDGLNVQFKYLERIGEPYMLLGIKFQKYKVPCTPYIFSEDNNYSFQSFADPEYIAISVDEKKDKSVQENLNSFDFEAAKAGKPVCTRDGRSARIICFDGNFISHPEWKIVALVENGTDEHDEQMIRYEKNGVSITNEEKDDLVMAPEKKDGWIIIFLRDGESYMDSSIFTSLKEVRKYLNRYSFVNGEKVEAIKKIEWKTSGETLEDLDKLISDSNEEI